MQLKFNSHDDFESMVRKTIDHLIFSFLFKWREGTMVIIKSGQNTHFTASQAYANIDFTHIKKSFLIKMNIKQYKY